jgi:hypothetical protein
MLEVRFLGSRPSHVEPVTTNRSRVARGLPDEARNKQMRERKTPFEALRLFQYV